MSDESNPFTEGFEEHWRAVEASEPAEEGYTGKECVYCGRIRVFVRKDGQQQCEKCEMIQPVSPSSTKDDKR